MDFAHGMRHLALRSEKPFKAAFRAAFSFSNDFSAISLLRVQQNDKAPDGQKKSSICANDDLSAK